MFVVRSDIATVKLCVTPSANGNGDLRGLARRCPENGSFTELICCFSRHYCRKRQGFTEQFERSLLRSSKTDRRGSGLPILEDVFEVRGIAERNGCGGIHKVFEGFGHIISIESLLKAEVFNIHVIFKFRGIELATLYADGFDCLPMLSNGFYPFFYTLPYSSAYVFILLETGIEKIIQFIKHITKRDVFQEEIDKDL